MSVNLTLMILPPDGEASLERSLTLEEVIAFRDQTMWPAVDKLWNGSFIEETALGGKIELQKELEKPGKPAVGFTLRAACISVPVGEEIDERVHCVVVGIAEEKPEQLRQLVSSINEANRNLGVDCGLYEDIEEYKAWLTQEYYFDTEDDDPLRVKMELRLINDEGELAFDPTLDCFIYQKDDDSSEDDSQDPCDELFSSLAEIQPTLTVSDTHKIKTALGVLGLSSCQ